MLNATLIFLGGGLGALSRWGLSSVVQRLAERTALHHFPWGIIACNLLGCFLIGLVFGHFATKAPAWVFPFAITGFLGGFTTFSTFGKDAHTLLTNGDHGLGLTYVLVSTIGGILLVFAGLKINSVAAL